MSAALEENNKGFNVIGFVNGNFGLSIAAQNTIRKLKRRNYGIAIKDFTPEKFRIPISDIDDFRCQGSAFPFKTSIIHTRPTDINSISEYLSAHVNAFVPFVELTKVPFNWICAMQKMDILLCPSHFIEHVISREVPGPIVRHYPQTVFLPENARIDRAAWGIPENGTIFICSFEPGSSSVRKNPFAVITAFNRAFETCENAYLVLKINNSDHSAESRRFSDRLKCFTSFNPHIIMIDRSLSYSDVLSLYASCDVFVSLHRAEGFGLCLLEAMMLGKATIATAWSGNMDFMDDTNSCLVNYKMVPVEDSDSYPPHSAFPEIPLWADPDVDMAARMMRVLFENTNYRKKIGDCARHQSLLRHESILKSNMFDMFENIRTVKDQPVESIQKTKQSVKIFGVRRPLRILFRNRSNVFDAPGGDTVVMREYKQHLEKKGFSIDFSSSVETNPGAYDLVHLFNMTLPQITDPFTKQAVESQVPVVATSLQEDFPLFYEKSKAIFSILSKYIESNQNPEVLRNIKETCALTSPHASVTSLFTGQNADRILPCGVTEERTIKRIIPQANTTIVNFGSSKRSSDADSRQFIELFGVKDFVLCVGRVEIRKNQLMLLKALEFENIPVVLIDSSSNCQSEYKDACARFKRIGKTVFTGRISDQLLISAYKAARVHCLPSFYELPGLVHLEAAGYGCNVVASSWGAAFDYLGDTCTYCSPDDFDSIKTTVLTAYENKFNKLAQERAEMFSWEKSTEQLVGVYENVLDCFYKNDRKNKCVPNDIYFSPLEMIKAISEMVEQSKMNRAIEIYNVNRVKFGEEPELRQLDLLMQRVRVRQFTA